MNGVDTNDERVLFVEVGEEQYEPQVNSFGMIRPFEAEDMPRVVDFADAAEAPPDGELLLARDADNDLEFPTYHFCLRGSFLFYFEQEDIDDDSGPYTSFLGPPVGVIPLQETVIEFPPGGRRIFREHAAHPKARKGYELVVLHEGEGERPPFFIVAQGLSAREVWAKALRDRANRSDPTKLRAGYSKTTQPRQMNEDDESDDVEDEPVRPKREPSSGTHTQTESEKPSLQRKSSRRTNSSGGGRVKSIRPDLSTIPLHEDKDLANAVEEFGMTKFDEKRWLDNFFERNNDFDAPTKCRQMEHWQADMKKSLKGAVLEQYEYFVQASGEMTTMGKEVASLKACIETQVDTIKDLKELDITGAIRLRRFDDDDKDELMGRLDKTGIISDTSLTSQMSSSGAAEPEEDDDAPRIEIPDWLDDVDDEVAATTRECRYKDAVDLLLKGHTEVSDLIDKHDRPTAYRMRRLDHERITRLQKTLEKLRKRLASRLAETLRRRNEALRQASKRERSEVVPIVVSPCALRDDVPYLRLLVKIGETQQAANAYTTRRSLLLLETLHERPISGSGNVDLVIYAAQISQSFFSCLAHSVEGFLDLFLSTAGGATPSSPQNEDMSLGESSFGARGVPSGAMSSVVLWCDSELSKFASAFGGSRILANLSLSPPPRQNDNGSSGPRVVGDQEEGTQKERKNAISVAAQCIEQGFLYATVNLDSVGLPLAPRLAECIRARLKGCEREVAELMDARWTYLTQDWKHSRPVDHHVRL